MSGPIVRKYGFPNFEKIFGERNLEHGVESPEKDAETPQKDSTAKNQPESAEGAAKTAPKREG